VIDGLFVLVLVCDLVGKEMMSILSCVGFVFFDGRIWCMLFVVGVLVGCMIFVVFVIGCVLGGGVVQTMVFVMLVFVEFVLVYGMCLLIVVVWEGLWNWWFDLSVVVSIGFVVGIVLLL